LVKVLDFSIAKLVPAKCDASPAQVPEVGKPSIREILAEPSRIVYEIRAARSL
jgi:hypothetical protein